ncbi:precorrin isomerase [Thermanaerovibrio velox DSM 12556]|uniref:Precorrin isomerase n=1 Tax=Thermanaerovibrio velox DSM 12556 TaxID=926567 RepID=H0UMY4_9BACT|nr:precorrin-8X methylmutase [Thermanaerovibrio velox]EHM09263.1 precorrin isomerase [Thermanaerovibrio velox DSM 12556]
MPLNYDRNPASIERKSLYLIRQVLGSYSIEPSLMPIAERVVHAGADFSLGSLVSASPDWLEHAKVALKDSKVFCDVDMVRSGLSRSLLSKLHLDPVCLIHQECTSAASAREGITRAMASVDRASQMGIRVFAFGNAPTGLFRLLELVEQGFEPLFVVAFPVGFVGAAESKELLLKSGVPCVSLRGPRGGSNLCAAAFNAVMRLCLEGEDRL